MGIKQEDDEEQHQSLLLQQQDIERVQVVSDSIIDKTWIEPKKLWGIAGPSIFSRLALFSITVMTQAFAGHLGDLNLAVISIATTVIISITFGFLLGMASALETLCGQAFGAKQYHMLGIYMQRSWIVLFFCSILLLPLFIFASPILKLIGQPTAVARKPSQLKTGVIALISGITLVIHLIITWVFVYKLRVGIIGTAITLDFSW